jgi:hypothetical protein
VEVRLRRGGGHRQLRRKRAGAGVLFKHFHFTAQNLADTVRKVLVSR